MAWTSDLPDYNSLNAFAIVFFFGLFNSGHGLIIISETIAFQFLTWVHIGMRS